MKVIFVDTETGGIDPNKVSILTFNALVCEFKESGSFKILDSLNLKLKPDDGCYHVNAEALAINGIDLVEHNKEAISIADGNLKLYRYLRDHTTKERMVCVGQHIHFDLEHMFMSGLIEERKFYTFMDKKVIDILTLASMAMLMGLIPRNQSCKLKDLAKYLGVPVDEKKLHDASYDNELAANVFSKMFKLFRAGQPEIDNDSI